MAFYTHGDTFAGKKVVWYDPNVGATEPPGSCFYRLGGFDYDDDEEEFGFAELLEQFVNDRNVQPIVGLIIGAWTYEMVGPNDWIIQLLADAQPQMPNLRALFIGDLICDENEISWIHQCAMAPLMNAYRELQHLKLRGGGSLQFKELDHVHLLSLTIESGGLGIEPLQDIFQAKLPNLEYLELWLGEPHYGGVSADQIEPLLRTNPFPKLRYMGLRNYSEIDQLCPSIAKSPFLDHIQILDLSNGNLSDVGLDALLNASERLKKLERLDLHHHYLSNEGIERVQALGIPVDVSEQLQGDGEDRYIVASE